MYARLQSTQAPLPQNLDGATAGPDMISATISAHPGFAGLYLMEQIAWGRGTMLSLWDTREDAESASERTAAVRGPRLFALDADDVYDVIDDWSGSSSAASGAPENVPTVAALVQLDGPISDPRFEAARRGGTQRVKPALAALPGIVRTLTLWQPNERKLAIVCLALSLDALDDAGRAVSATSLLPGEDAALLMGPDRVVPHHVIRSTQPATARV